MSTIDYYKFQSARYNNDLFLTDEKYLKDSVTDTLKPLFNWDHCNHTFCLEIMQNIDGTAGQWVRRPTGWWKFWKNRKVYCIIFGGLVPILEFLKLWDCFRLFLQSKTDCIFRKRYVYASRVLYNSRWVLC